MASLPHTPIEAHIIQGRKVWVKREDQCAPEDWPPFSKMRGLFSYLHKRRDEGLQVAGYVDTTVSMAGWGVSAVCQDLGMEAVIWGPTYKDPNRPDLKLLRYHWAQWEHFGARVISIQATRLQINHHLALKQIDKLYEGRAHELLPIGLPFPQSVDETAAEWRWTVGKLGLKPAVTVACVGSGTIFSGILKAWQPGEGRMIGVLVHDKNPKPVHDGCYRKAGLVYEGLAGVRRPFTLLNPKWHYELTSKAECPFPCHPYYDLKAWQWLLENLHRLPDPVLFWNIGRTPVLDA